jgi:hypothetical protein
MRTPIWTMVPAGATVVVELHADPGVAVDGSVVTAAGNAPPARRSVNAGNFPLRLRVEAGSALVVELRATSAGGPARVSVAAGVAGEAGEPELRILEMDEANPVATTTVMAVAL